ncbi:MAG: hypothetical protein KatS3mg012_1780 [Gaiellaceae bacterium]|jgi:uncharacterized protein YkwD|nr:MAG: hypothetical protein KatS3mg012_1780 [Gaiellaceae bacterium]
MRLVLLAFALALLAWLPAAAQARSGERPRDVERRAELEREVLQELNRVRSARGLTPLRVAAGLRAAAFAHSETMVVEGFFSHTRPDGTPFHERIRRFYTRRGWSSWSVGETLYAASGTQHARAIVASWLASPPHREIILAPGWRDAGIGVAYRSSAPGVFGGRETLVVTAAFGIRESRVPVARLNS